MCYSFGDWIPDLCLCHHCVWQNTAEREHRMVVSILNIHIVCLNLIKSNNSGGSYVPSWYRSVSFSLSCHVLEPKYFHGINTLKHAEFKSENFPSDRWKSISGEAELITIHIIMCCNISCEINYIGCLWTRKYEYVPPPPLHLSIFRVGCSVLLLFYHHQLVSRQIFIVGGHGWMKTYDYVTQKD